MKKATDSFCFKADILFCAFLKAQGAYDSFVRNLKWSKAESLRSYLIHTYPSDYIVDAFCWSAVPESIHRWVALNSRWLSIVSYFKF